MDDSTQTFNRLRPRLQGIACRMLGAKAESEVVAQDAWLRWNEVVPATLDSVCCIKLPGARLRTASSRAQHPMAYAKASIKCPTGSVVRLTLISMS